MEVAALLVTALLFGGSVLYSFGFAGFIFSVLPSDQAGGILRRAFPHFYSFVFLVSAMAAVLLFLFDGLAAFIMAMISITTIPTRQILMPAINRATDSGRRRKFQILHSLSVIITLTHICASAFVIVRFA